MHHEKLKKFQTDRERLAIFFNRYRRYDDLKTNANPLSEKTYCLFSNQRQTLIKKSAQISTGCIPADKVIGKKLRPTPQLKAKEWLN